MDDLLRRQNRILAELLERKDERLAVVLRQLELCLDASKQDLKASEQDLEMIRVLNETLEQRNRVIVLLEEAIVSLEKQVDLERNTAFNRIRQTNMN